jgi:cytochrome c biogenesis protein CcdA
MERLVHFSMDLFKYSAFIGAFNLGVFFALGWAPCAVSLVFPVLIWLISQNVTLLAGGMMLFVFVFGIGHGVPVIPIATFSRAVGRTDRGEVHLCWEVGYEDLRVGCNRRRPDLCDEVLRIQALVN